jgi:hypothetical protein
MFKYRITDSYYHELMRELPDTVPVSANAPEVPIV